MGNFGGILAGALANAGLSTYERLDKIDSEKLSDELRRQQIASAQQSLQSGSLDLAQKQRQAKAAQAIDTISQQFQNPAPDPTAAPAATTSSSTTAATGQSADGLDAADTGAMGATTSTPSPAASMTPGLGSVAAASPAAAVPMTSAAPAPAATTKSGPDFSYLSDPAKFAQYQAAIAPHMMTMLGPERGLAALKDAQLAAQHLMPQAAQQLALGNVDGAMRLAKASPSGKDLQSITPVMGDDGKPNGDYTFTYNHGAYTMDPDAMMQAFQQPGEYLKSKAAQQEADARTQAAETAASEAPSKIASQNAQAGYYKAHGDAVQQAAAAAMKRADNSGGKDDNAKAAIRLKFGVDLSKYTRENYSSVDPVTFKSVSDPHAGDINSIATQLFNTAPDAYGDVPTAAEAAKGIVDTARDEAANKVADLKDAEPKGMFSSDDNKAYWQKAAGVLGVKGVANAQDFEAKAAPVIYKSALKSALPAALGSGAPSSAPAPAVNPLEGKTVYRGGQPFVVRNGQPVPVQTPATPQAPGLQSVPAGSASAASGVNNAANIPGPPPATLGLTSTPNPSYVQWEQQYGDAYRQQQARQQAGDDARNAQLMQQYNQTRSGINMRAGLGGL